VDRQCRDLQSRITRRLDRGACCSPGEKYEVTLGGTNLTDDRYLVVDSVNGAEGETVGTYNPPRQWYLNLRMNFE
jgi:outer membrane receptor protein involved in Fe transport